MAHTQTTVEVTMGSTRYAPKTREVRRNTGEVVAAGCDWLSVTQLHGSEAESLRELAHAICAEEIDRGMEPDRAPMRRYHGFRAGQCSFGERAEDVMMQLSGAAAQRYAEDVLPLARNVSRCDLQVTVELPSIDREIGRRAYERAKRGTGKKGRPTSATEIRNTSGGNTVYLGSQKSDRFVRIYDKGIESGSESAGRLWRCEAVLKGRVAKAAALTLKSHGVGPTSTEALVRSEMERKSGKLFWIPGVRELRIVTPEATTATVDRKLNWLCAQVRPSVAWLLMRGCRAEVLEALGLEEGTSTYLEDSSQPVNSQ